MNIKITEVTNFGFSGFIEIRLFGCGPGLYDPIPGSKLPPRITLTERPGINFRPPPYRTTTEVRFYRKRWGFL